jgi:segregation and condensation protein A
MTFRANLEIYRGPLDLLLYLVRKHELEIEQIPIAPLTQQYLEYLAVLKLIDLNAVGDFLEVASTLAEMKSQAILPRQDEGAVDEEPIADARHELVRQLLEYKRFKEAASLLEERARLWQDRFARRTAGAPPPAPDPAQQPIHELEIWDLVSALGRVLREHQSLQPENIVYDETPIHVHMLQIHALLMQRDRVAFTELFRPGMHKSTLVGVFLAMMELMRNHGVIAEQERLFGEIWLRLAPDHRQPLPLDLGG